MLSASPTPAALVDALEMLAAGGLDAQGVTTAEDGAVQRVLPGAASVVVLGSGGGRLWAGFLAALRRTPAQLCDEQHPLDAHVRRIILGADALLPAELDRRWVLCGALPLDPAEGAAPPFLDFRRLALAAGLGHGSRLGLLLHPRFGPWLGLRAALVLRTALPPTGPLAGVGPCPACAAPCATACPVAAVPSGPTAPDAAGALRFDIRACATHRADGGCATRCDARNACPVGVEHRYDSLEQHYHDNRGAGRAALAAALGLVDDRHVGLGPQWSAWARSAAD